MPSFRAESAFSRSGLTVVAGLDEVGRGAWAGPLVAGAVILPAPTAGLRKTLGLVNDSKQLTPLRREQCALQITEIAIAYATGMVSAAEVDAFGMTHATHEAMRRAIAQLAVAPEALLLDAFLLPTSPLPQRAIIRGDSWSFSIAAASILAKVTRDAWMCNLANQYPAYAFEQHKGYGTAFHHDALLKFGATPEHRRSFAPIRALLACDESAAEIAA
jgi:ribonuclease HII